MKKRSVYLISGPAGAGKSTTSEKIAGQLSRSAHIEGDLIDHMVVGGHEKPWLSQSHTDLIWLNILSLTRNFIDQGFDVVIDYVGFMKNAEYIADGLEGRNAEVKFVILITNEDVLLRRDAERKPEFRMGLRCIAGLEEFRQSRPPLKHIIDSTDMEVEKVIDKIMSDDELIVNHNRKEL
jgi:2-phosphoglycerate kinase